MATWIAEQPAALRVAAVASFLKDRIIATAEERRHRREDWRAFHSIAALNDAALADLGFSRRDVDAVSMWADRPTADLVRIANARAQEV